MVFYSFKYLHIPVTIFNPSLDVKKKNKISFACKNRGTFLFFHFLSFNIVAKQRATCFKEGEIKKCIGSPQLMNLTY